MSQQLHRRGSSGHLVGHEVLAEDSEVYPVPESQGDSGGGVHRIFELYYMILKILTFLLKK